MDFKKYITKALTGPEPGDKIEYFNIKNRVSGNVLSNAQKNIPAGGYNYEADITKFWEEFTKLKSNCGYKLTLITIILRVLTEGLKAAPRLNAHMDYKSLSSSGRLIIKKHVDVAVPMIIDGETFPVKIRNLEERTLKETAEEFERIQKTLETTDVDRLLFDIVLQRLIGFVIKGKLVSTAAQIATGYVGKYKVAEVKGLLKHVPHDDTSLQIDDMNEGSVCLTNLGSLYKGLSGNVTYAPILYPQVFIMAIGAVQDRDYAFKNEDGVVDIATKKILPINLMFDHRIGGFNDVIPFIKKLDEIFANPEVIHTW